MYKLNSRLAALVGLGMAVGIIVMTLVPRVLDSLIAQGPSFPGLGVALAAPALQTAAFPQEEAGFSAYLDVGEAIQDLDDLVEIATLCRLLPVEMGANHMRCDVSATIFDVVPIQLYADLDGIVVAYFTSNQPTSLAAVWTSDESAPEGSTDFGPVFESPTMALDEILRRAVEKLGVDYPSLAPNTGYFHWQFPEATVLTAFAKVSNNDNGRAYYFSIPDDVTLFEVSVTGYGTSSHQPLYLDDAKVLHFDSVVENLRRTGAGTIDLERVTPEILHKVSTGARAVSAVYLLWIP